MKLAYLSAIFLLLSTQCYALTRSECVDFVNSKGYSGGSAVSACVAIDVSDEVQSNCLKFILNSNYSPNVAGRVCGGISSTTFSCVRDWIISGYSPEGSLDRCLGRR